MSGGFLAGGILAGPGLFALPFVLPRANFAVDVLSRPLGELDMFVGASVHRLLPLANVLVPLALLITTFHIKAARGFVGGIAAGTAAYLTSLVILGTTYGPFGSVGLTVFAGVNAALCLLIARFALVHK